MAGLGMGLGAGTGTKKKKPKKRPPRGGLGGAAAGVASGTKNTAKGAGAGNKQIKRARRQARAERRGISGAIRAVEGLELNPGKAAINLVSAVAQPDATTIPSGVAEAFAALTPEQQNTLGPRVAATYLKLDVAPPAPIKRYLGAGLASKSITEGEIAGVDVKVPDAVVPKKAGRALTAAARKSQERQNKREDEEAGFGERLIEGGLIGLVDEDASDAAREFIYGKEKLSGTDIALSAPIPGVAALRGAGRLVSAVRGGQRATTTAKAASATTKAAKAGRTARGTNVARGGAQAARVARGAKGGTAARSTARARAGARAGALAQAAGRTRTGAAAANVGTKVSQGAAAVSRPATTAAQKIAVRQTVRRSTRRGIRRKGGKGGDARTFGMLGAGGSGIAGAVPVLAGPTGEPEFLRAAQLPVQLAVATAGDPKTIAAQSWKSFRDSILGAPAAVLLAINDPEKAIKMVKEDYERRYGPLIEGNYEEFRRRVTEEGGLTPFAMDALIVAPPASRVGGALARSGGLGRKAQRWTTEERPALRVNPTEAKPQELSKGLIGATTQRAIDRRRARASEARIDGGRRRAVEPENAGKPSPGGRPAEVVPLFKGSRVAKAVGGMKGRARLRQMAEQAEEINRGLLKDYSILAKHQRDAIKYAIQFGIRTPEQARKILPGWIERIKAARAENAARHAAGEGGDHKLFRAPAKAFDELPVLERLLDNADTVFDDALAAFADATRDRAMRLARMDPGVATEQALLRTFEPLARLLGIERRGGDVEAANADADPLGAAGKQADELEPAADYIERIREAAREHGLADPGFFPSKLSRTQPFSTFAVGGTRAINRDQRYTGKLLEHGLEDTRIDALTTGLARNIKRKHNWNLVGDIFDQQTFAWGRNKSMTELLQELAERGIREDSIVFHNPGRFRRARQSAERGDNEVGDDNVAEGMADVEGIKQALDDSTVDGAGVRQRMSTNPDDFADTDGWSVMPREAFDELSAGMTQGRNVVARSFDIQKQKSARILLGSLNLPWLQFQIASNAMLTGLAVGPRGLSDIARAHRWWKRLTPEQKRAVEPYVGIGNFQADIKLTKLGASVSDRRDVDAYRALKESIGGKALFGGKSHLGFQQVRDLNPFDVMFRMDEAQNNFFRRAVLYNEAKRIAYERMGRNAGEAGSLMDDLVPRILGKKVPEQKINALLESVPDLERLGTKVNDFLGDYTSYTARERAYLNRNVMFYGYLRFSLRFMLKTMPLKHPVMSGILAQLGRLKVEELRELYGGDNLPWALGRYYIDKAGGPLMVDLGRFNPLSNVITSATGIRSLTGLLPPTYLMAAAQVFQKDPFTGKDWLLEGETQTRPGFVGLAAEERLRVLLATGIKMFYPGRVWTELELEGEPQGADSLPWDPRPTEYVDEDLVQSIGRDKRALAKRGTWDRINDSLFPLIPHPTRDLEFAKVLDEKKDDYRKSLEEKGGVSESSGGGWGGSSSGGGWG